MIDFELQQLHRHPEWQLVLAAYHGAQTAALEANPDQTPWIPRLREVEGVKDEQLARIHGKLIALGFLKFELAGRNDGVVYQLTQEGKRAVGDVGPEGDDATREAGDGESAPAADAA